MDTFCIIYIIISAGMDNSKPTVQILKPYVTFYVSTGLHVCFFLDIFFFKFSSKSFMPLDK